MKTGTYLFKAFRSPRFALVIVVTCLLLPQRGAGQPAHDLSVVMIASRAESRMAALRASLALSSASHSPRSADCWAARSATAPGPGPRADPTNREMHTRASPRSSCR